jgi:hypothetical protein
LLHISLLITITNNVSATRGSRRQRFGCGAHHTSAFDLGRQDALRIAPPQCYEILTLLAIFTAMYIAVSRCESVLRDAYGQKFVAGNQKLRKYETAADFVLRT